MQRVAYHCSHEQHAPSVLLEHARAAERAGSGAAMCSDHFMPWSAEAGQGQSGFAWSWLGAALAATQMSFDWLARDLELGIDRIYVHHVGPTTAHQQAFFAELAADLLRL